MKPSRPLALPSSAVGLGEIRAEIGGIRLTVGSEHPPDKLAALLRELIRP